MLQPGMLLEGKYRILREIGRGGMSRVYLALNERANRTWAVKEIRREAFTDNGILNTGLADELKMLRKLHHPYLPDIVDVIEEEDCLLIIMEYIQGRDLQKILDDRNRAGSSRNCGLDPAAVKAWAVQLCDVLEYLHSRQPPIIYRDLKPANVMVQEDHTGTFPYGSVCLIDFGTAREMRMDGTGDTVALGTRGYAAPEQFGGLGETDARTDIFNLGATLYHLLTGCSPAQTNYTFLPIGTLRPELSDSGLEKIVARCCEPAREDRYQSAADVRHDLENEGLLSGPAVRRDQMRWHCFLAAAVVFILSAVSSLVLGCAGWRMRNSTYEALIHRAESAENVPEGSTDWMNAVCLAPGRPHAYRALLHAIDSDDLFTAGERRTLEDCLACTAAGHSLPNMEELRRTDPVSFDQVMYGAGVDYFFFYENEEGYRYAAQKFESVYRAENLNEERNEGAICESLQMIAQFCVKESQEKKGKSWIRETDAARIWEELCFYTGDPSSASVRCGSGRIAAAMYMELCRQILQSADVFRDAGVGRDRMIDAIASAEEYAEKYREEKAGGEDDRELLQQMQEVIDAASFRVGQLFS